MASFGMWQGKRDLCLKGSSTPCNYPIQKGSRELESGGRDPCKWARAGFLIRLSHSHSHSHTPNCFDGSLAQPHIPTYLIIASIELSYSYGRGKFRNMSALQKQEHRNLIKDYNIHFDGPIDQDQWPSAHFQTFSNIQKLGRTGFVAFRESITVDSEDNPWRGQTRRRAERIVNLAKICRDGRKNEPGWRLSVESEILARFTIEVACRRCRARLWRSELEATASSLDRFSESLEERQKKRIPCTCRPGKRGVDGYVDDFRQLVLKWY